MEHTLAIIKPEAFRRKVVAQILTMIMQNDFVIVAMGKVRVSRTLALEHYQEHEGQEYFIGLLGQMTERDVFAMVLEGPNAIALLRELIGPFRKGERIRGTIRHRFMRRNDPDLENFIHGSDSPASAEREIALWSPFLDF